MAQQEAVSRDLRFFYWPNRIQMDVQDPLTGEFRDSYRPPPEITLYIPAGEDMLAIPTAFRTGTEVFHYRGDGVMPVYLKPPRPDENGLLPPPDAQVDLRAFGGSVFILMRVNVDAGAVSFFPISDDSAKAPQGSYTLVNISGKDVAVALNGSFSLLKDRSAQNKPSGGEARYDDLSVVVGDEQDYEVVSNLRLPRPKKSRYLVFVRDETGAGDVDVDVISF